MNSKEYLEQSGRTAASVELNYAEFDAPQQVLHEMVTSVHAGMSADAIKRSLFYKAPDIAERMNTNKKVLTDLYGAIVENPKVEIPADKVDLLHAALGLQSEAGEITEEIVTSIIKGRPVDVENVKEELGDQLWYIALALRAIGVDFDTIMQENIDKLAKRYPEKFTTEDALARADKSDQTA